MQNFDKSIFAELQKYAEDILTSDGMESEKNFIQHGTTSCYEHSVMVACMSVKLADKFGISVDRKSLIRGALLHDYFLYDWHIPDKSHRWHGFTHPAAALKNAERDFQLNKIERNIILRHMFPLNMTPPVYKESMIVCIADKICALQETFSFLYRKKEEEIPNVLS